MNNKYQRGKIYKIVDNTNGNQYIGSTCEKTLAHRLAKHVVGCYKNWSNGGKTNYISSFDIIANIDYDIILIEEFPCQTKDELLARERHYEENLICVNKNRPIISNDERKEYDRQHSAKYYQYHKEHINAKNNCIICSGKYSTQHKVQHLKTQQHQNAIKLNGILSNHEKIINKLEQIIFEANEFIKLSENFIKRLNI